MDLEMTRQFEWDESKHPREPAGQDIGGQFAPGGEIASDVIGGRSGESIKTEGIFYHGTSSDVAAEILKRGLRKDKAGKIFGSISDRGHVFLTRNIDEAQYWGDYAKDEVGADGVAIVVVRLPRNTPAITDKDVKGGVSVSLKRNIPPGWIDDVLIFKTGRWTSIRHKRFANDERLFFIIKTKRNKQFNGYSRALMGFDFADASALLAARKKFADYLAENSVDRDQAESDAQGLNHSWEFATYAFCPTGEGGGIDNSCSPVNEGDTIEVEGKQRGVENSMKQKIHSTKEGVQNFYKWFRNSKIVNDDDAPLVVYHGTGASFDEFDPNKTATSPRGSSGSLGFFFTKSTKEGSGYGSGYPEGGSVLPVYLSIQNPKKIDRYSDLWDRVLNSRRDAKAVQTELKKQGYDGAITPLGEYVAFSPTQIKSVFNKGKFDPTNPKINFSFDPIQDLGKSFMLRHMPPWRGLMDMKPGSLHLKIFGKYAELREGRSYDCQWCGIHRYHLPGQHDQCAHSPTGQCEVAEDRGESDDLIDLISPDDDDPRRYDDMRRKDVKWRGDLTGKERTTLTSYRDRGAFEEINDAMRGGGMPKSVAKGATLKRALDRNRMDDDITIWRGMNIVGGEEGRNFRSRLKAGAIFSDNGFVSASPSSAIAGAFASSDEGVNVLFKLKTRGAYGAYVAEKNRQPEIIFTAGSKIRINKVMNKRGGLVVVEGIIGGR